MDRHIQRIGHLEGHFGEEAGQFDGLARTPVRLLAEIPCLHRLVGEQQLQAADDRALAAVVLADEKGRFGQMDIRLLDPAEVCDDDSGKTQLPPWCIAN